MEHDVFEKPVRVLAGLGIPREIGTVFQAFAFLTDRPGDRSSPDHMAARKTCLAAIHRRGDAETARTAFESFARRAGILVEDMDDVIAARSAAALAGRASA